MDHWAWSHMTYSVVNVRSHNHHDCGQQLQSGNIPLLIATIQFFLWIDIPAKIQEAVELILCDFFAKWIGPIALRGVLQHSPRIYLWRATSVITCSH